MGYYHFYTLYFDTSLKLYLVFWLLSTLTFRFEICYKFLDLRSVINLHPDTNLEQLIYQDVVLKIENKPLSKKKN